MRRTLATALLGLGLIQGVSATAIGIVVDGDPSDWGAEAALHTDSTGDQGSGSIDFENLWVANDADRVFMRIEVGTEIEMQDVNSIKLYIDADSNSSTGLSVGGIGAEIEWAFGARSGTAYSSTGVDLGSGNWDDVDLRLGPTVTSNEFEISFSRTGAIQGVDMFPGSDFDLLFQNEDGGVQDRLPNSGQTVSYTFDATAVPTPPRIPLDRQDPNHFRLVTQNTLTDGLFNGSRGTPHERIIQALDADIHCFQEEYALSATDAANHMASLLGGTWYAAKNNDCVTTSRWPITSSVGINGNLGALIDVPDSLSSHDVYVISVHYPCCDNEASRQNEVDNVIAHIRDLMTVGGSIDLPVGTPIFVTGDTNFVGYHQQLVTQRTGDIQDEGTYGSDHAPDWDGSDMLDIVPLHTGGDDVATWYNTGSNFNPGRIDLIFCTDSVATPEQSYVLFTPNLTVGELSATGLLANDSTDASDHLAVVGDFSLPSMEVVIPVTPITDLDTVRADGLAGGGTEFKTQGIVTSVGLSSGRNQFTIQDATGAIVVDDPSGNFLATAGANAQEGDLVTITGTTALFSGLAELQPTASGPSSIESSGNSLPDVVILPDLASVTNADQGEIICVQNVWITGGGTNPVQWEAGTNYTITDGSTSLNFRIGTATTGWDGTSRPINAVPFDVVGTINDFNAAQIHARSEHPGNGTLPWNGTADTGPDVLSAGAVPVGITFFGEE